MRFQPPVLRRALRATFSREHFRPRHAAFALGVTAVLSLLLGVNRLLQALDRRLYPELAAEPVVAPIFILANPRSGTTFLHRLMALDPRFDTLKLWQTIAPNLCTFRAVERLGGLDRALGRPVARLAGLFDRLLFRGWQGVHDTGLARDEEDEMWWLYNLLTPSVMLGFPFPDELLPLVRADALPPDEQERVARSYRALLQRHRYAARLAGRGDRTFLGKAALAAGRIGTMRRALPDLRVIHLVRHPYEAISSTTSMFSRVWRVHSPERIGDTHACRGWARVACESYRLLHGVAEDFGPERFIEIRYDDLIADPELVIRQIYATFGLEMSDEYRAILRRELGRHRDWESDHEHELATYGLSEHAIHAELKDLFEAYGFEP